MSQINYKTGKRRCASCDFVGILKDFGIDSKKTGYWKSYCKKCQKQKRKILYTKSPWYKKNPEKHLINCRKSSRCYKLKHPEYIKQWNIKNKKRLQESQKKRWKQDPSFRIKMICRHRVWKALKNAKIKKSDKTIELLGCSWNFYKSYLESLFLPLMGWNNISEWQIDHIRPLASFNLLIKQERFKAFHWSNTRPIWKIENQRKGSKWLAVL